MEDSLKRKLLEQWVENYSGVYKKIKIIKHNIEDLVKKHDREGIPLCVLSPDCSIKIQKKLYLFPNRMWNRVSLYVGGTSLVEVIKFLKKKLCLFDGPDYMSGTIMITVEIDICERPKIVRNPKDFPWVVELQEFVDEYIRSADQFLTEAVELLNKLCKTSLNSEKKLLDLIKYERVKEINL